MELKTYFAQDRAGNVVPSAIITLYVNGTETLASGLQTVSGTTLANPFSADANGKIQFKAPDGLYDMQIKYGEQTGLKVTIQCLDLTTAMLVATQQADLAQQMRDETQSIINAAGEQSTLVVLDQPSGLSKIGIASDLTAIRTIIPTKAGQQMRALAFHPGGVVQSNPVGGGLFISEANTTYVDQGSVEGTLYRAGPNYCWRRVRENAVRFTPFEFGAKCDGVYDDALSIQKAIAAAGVIAQDVGDVRTPSGFVDMSGATTWYCKSKLTLNLKRVAIECGRSLLDFKSMPEGTESAPTVAVECTSASGYMQDRIKISNLKLLGPGRTKYVNAITIKDPNTGMTAPRNSAIFEGLSIEGFYDALILGDNAFFLSFFNCQIAHNHRGYVFHDSNNAGEEINFYNCVWNANDINMYIGGGMSNFYGCSSDHAYGVYLYQIGGLVNYVNSWMEGYGPTDYVVYIPDGAAARLNIIGGQLVFNAGYITVATKPFGYAGNQARIVFERTMPTNFLHASTTTANVPGWFDGTGSVVIKDTQLRIAKPGSNTWVRARVQPGVSTDNQLESSHWTSGTSGVFYDEVFLLPPVGGDTYRVSRYQYGIDAGTPQTFALTRFAGYVRLMVWAAGAATTYKACLGMIKLNGNGPVTYQASITTNAGDGNGSITLSIVWVKAITYGPTGTTEPLIIRQLTGMNNTYTFSGSKSTSKDIVTPSNIPAIDPLPVSWDRAPQWATHAMLVADVSNLARSVELKIKDVYMRQI